MKIHTDNFEVSLRPVKNTDLEVVRAIFLRVAAKNGGVPLHIVEGGAYRFNLVVLNHVVRAARGLRGAEGITAALVEARTEETDFRRVCDFDGLEGVAI